MGVRRRRPHEYGGGPSPSTGPSPYWPSSPPSPGCAGVHSGLEKGLGGRRAGAALSAMRLQPLTVSEGGHDPGAGGRDRTGRLRKRERRAGVPVGRIGRVGSSAHPMIRPVSRPGLQPAGQAGRGNCRTAAAMRVRCSVLRLNGAAGRMTFGQDRKRTGHGFRSAASGRDESRSPSPAR